MKSLSTQATARSKHVSAEPAQGGLLRRVPLAPLDHELALPHPSEDLGLSGSTMRPPVQIKPDASTELEHVFVYGTLKRGQCREYCWPSPPVSVQPAWTLGSLFDLGPYPGLLVGSDRVLGELWSFHTDDMRIVLAVLDRIEGTNQVGEINEYERVRVAVTCWNQAELLASTYRYADHSVARQLAPVRPSCCVDGQAYVQWPSGSTNFADTH